MGKQNSDDQPRYGQRLNPDQLGTTPTNSPHKNYASTSGSGAASGGWSWQRQEAQNYRPKRRWGVFVVGLVLMIVVPIALGVGALKLAVDGSLMQGAVFSETGQIYLDAGKTTGIYSSDPQVAVSQCSVSDPNGAAVEIAAADTSSSLITYGSFTATQTGKYELSCPASDSSFVVGPALNQERILTAGTLLLAAGAIGFVGLLLTIWGIVRLVRKR